MALAITSKVLNWLEKDLSKEHPFLAKYIFSRPVEFECLDKYKDDNGQDRYMLIANDRFQVSNLSRLFWYGNPNGIRYDIWGDD